MIRLTSSRLTDSVHRHLIEKGFHRMRCRRGHVLFVWASNDCACHRARCWACKDGPSYMVDVVQRKNVKTPFLITVRDTYEEQVVALNSYPRECSLATEVKKGENKQLDLFGEFS